MSPPPLAWYISGVDGRPGGRDDVHEGLGGVARESGGHVHRRQGPAQQVVPVTRAEGCQSCWQNNLDGKKGRKRQASPDWDKELDQELCGPSPE